ncbi:MAG: hypothetical protein KOO60_12680 [Gemmatimonadales bacterium]|nr:hypothetical protein [Gemmatimonadales bacterium]
MRKKYLVLCVLPVLVLSLAVASLAETVMIDGVEHIRNGAQPYNGVQDVKLHELWRAGGEDDDVFFGLVPRVLTDPEGNVYILDSQTCQVYVYGPEGELLRKLFREGEGPGEVLRPRDMVLMGDGRVGLMQEFPGAISFVQKDGTPANRIQLIGIDGGVMGLTSCDAAGEVLLFAGNHDQDGGRPEVRNRWNVLERHGPDGKIMARFADNHAVYDFGDFHFREKEHLPVFWFTFAAAQDGRVFTATDHKKYAVNVCAPDGTLQRVIEREYEPLERTDAEFHRLELMIKSAFTGMSIQPKIEIERRESVLAYFHRAIQLHPDGNLWVLSGRGLRPEIKGVMAVFDVFDDAGLFVKQVALHAPHDGRDVGIFLSGTGRVLVVKGYMDSLAAQFGNGTALADEGYEPQAPEVICYGMK